ncbi:MAG: NAD(P)H-hydrate dehydratase [Candidatus Poribacteria bacterium]|nr:NAD(P)H-hydrate dehydratase [Candidatus Poribacteria bacterium]MDE0503416.1 NAD(P)H-hydrate dehydratase [Candidatus Poribacteria bacterium]
MKVVTAEEMRQIDKQTIEGIGIPGIVLMETAAMAVFRSIQSNFPECRSVGVIVGKGNNGGDGLALARQLCHEGYAVKIVLVSPPERFSGDALTNLQVARNLGLPILEVLSEPGPKNLGKEIISCDLIVDAIFGTGLRGGIEGHIRDVIDWLNSGERPIVAIDLPSGLNADTGGVEGACICADRTVTIGLPKRGTLLYPGAQSVGALEIADIGFPHSIVESQGIPVNWTQAAQASDWIPSRPAYSHKGTYGRVLLLAGSPGMTGAAVLASQASIRTGTGLVTLGIPESLNSIVEASLAEVMTIPLSETTEGTLALAAKSQILEFVERTAPILAIGPGLSRNPETVRLVHSLILEIDRPTVIDADGLNALAEGKSNRSSAQSKKADNILSHLPTHTILTPHPGEMARLTGLSVRDIEKDRIGVSREFAREHEVTLVLKGVPTIIALLTGEVWINSTGNAGMATGGMGDVLTGLIAGLMAQGLQVAEAGVLGAYLHGLAGDISAESTGMHGLIAGDVLESIPEAIERSRHRPSRDEIG